MAWITVKEKRRTYICTTGFKFSLHNVTLLNLDETWIRTQSDEGLVMTNPNNLLAIHVLIDEGGTTINPPHEGT